MFGEGMRRRILFGYDHDLQGRVHHYSKSAIMAAAARVFPAPKTPLMGQSVRPSKMD